MLFFSAMIKKARIKYIQMMDDSKYMNERNHTQKKTWCINPFVYKTFRTGTTNLEWKDEKTLYKKIRCIIGVGIIEKSNKESLAVAEFSAFSELTIARVYALIKIHHS